MCRRNKTLGTALVAFGAGMLLSLIIGSVFFSILLGVVALGIGIWLLIK